MVHCWSRCYKNIEIAFYRYENVWLTVSYLIELCYRNKGQRWIFFMYLYESNETAEKRNEDQAAT